MRDEEVIVASWDPERHCRDDVHEKVGRIHHERQLKSKTREVVEGIHTGTMINGAPTRAQKHDIIEHFIEVV